MSIKLLTEHHLELLSLKVGYTGSSKSTLVKMPHCWKSHVMAQIVQVLVFAIGLVPDERLLFSRARITSLLQMYHNALL